MSQKLSFSTKSRMWFDYLRYITFLQKGESLELVVEVSLFLFSIFLLKQELFPQHERSEENSTISIFVGLVILKFLWEIYETRKRIASYFNIQRTTIRNPSNIMHLIPSEKERLSGFVGLDIPLNKPDRVFVSNEINRHIQTKPLTISLSDHKKHRIHQYLESHQEVLKQFLNYYFFSSLKHNREFINNEKFCMSADITLHSHTVSCHTGGYYDSFLTNQIIGITLIIQDKKHTMINTEHIFPSHKDEDNKSYLSDIASAPMNNHVGCSTIGFTKDHKLLIWVQGNANQFSTNLLVPTGSGSTNASDMINNDFKATIIRAMERELAEETIADGRITNMYETMILGFFRWVSRGGKPEFVGITKLSGDADMYKPNNIEVTTKNTKNHVFNMPSIDALPKVIEDIRQTGPLSVPLFMCLRELEYMYHNHKDELEKFLFDK